MDLSKKFRSSWRLQRHVPRIYVKAVFAFLRITWPETSGSDELPDADSVTQRVS